MTDEVRRRRPRSNSSALSRIEEVSNMPKMKTNRGAAKRFKKTGQRQDRPRARRIGAIS